MHIRIKQLLKEGLNELASHQGGETYYHGSLYPKLQWSAAPEDAGWATEGYGLYITPDKNQAIGYALKEKTQGYLYRLILGDLNTQNFDEPVSGDIISYIKRDKNFFSSFYSVPDFKDFDFDDMSYQLGEITYEWDYLDEPMPEWAKNERPGIFLVRYINDKQRGKTIFGLGEDDVLRIIKSENEGKSILNKKISSHDLTLAISPDEIDLEPFPDIHYDTLFDKFSDLYWYASYHFNSMKKASYFFRKAGVDAFDVTSWNTPFINLINPTKIVDIQSQKVKWSKGDKFDF